MLRKSFNFLIVNPLWVKFRMLFRQCFDKSCRSSSLRSLVPREKQSLKFLHKKLLTWLIRFMSSCVDFTYFKASVSSIELLCSFDAAMSSLIFGVSFDILLHPPLLYLLVNIIKNYFGVIFLFTLQLLCYLWNKNQNKHRFLFYLFYDLNLKRYLKMLGKTCVKHMLFGRSLTSTC